MNSNLSNTAKMLRVIFLLYAFLTGIKLMGIAFQMFGKPFAEQLLASCNNPFSGLFIGILATSLVQSSSITTSLVVGLAGGGVLPVSFAVPVIMGANIGTTITNLMVSLAFAARKEDFRRAFAGAAVHDFFNLFSVMLFFPLEIKFHLIEKAAVRLAGVFEGTAALRLASPLDLAISPATRCAAFFFRETLSLSETACGIALLVLSLAMLISALVFLVKTMHSLVIGRAELFINRYLFKNDFAAFLLGISVTVAVQSSSITTSLIVPLVGAGLVSLRRCYPYTLGANIGTTCTALLASMATLNSAGGDSTRAMGLTIAFAHLIFNFGGTAVFYPLKMIPIYCAQKLSELAAKSRKLAIVFVLGAFYILPLSMIFIRKLR